MTWIIFFIELKKGFVKVLKDLLIGDKEKIKRNQVQGLYFKRLKAKIVKVPGSLELVYLIQVKINM